MSHVTLDWHKNFNDKSHQNKIHLLASSYKEIIKNEGINEDLSSELFNLYYPLADWIAAQHTDTPLILGINGAQGSGKSTLCLIIEFLLLHGFNKSALTLSIDDFYYSKSKRNQLAATIHPLLMTRGVPGTHDVEHLRSVLMDFKNNHLMEKLKLPLFDKSIDDVVPENLWKEQNAKVDIILFEGWCVGATAQTQSQLDLAINELEEKEDPNGVWRRYVNEQLKSSYQNIFKLIDYQVMLKVPSMSKIFEWRSLQEEKLLDKCRTQEMDLINIMSKTSLTRFLMHYERITAECLQTMPQTADIVLQLNDRHLLDKVIFND